MSIVNTSLFGTGNLHWHPSQHRLGDFDQEGWSLCHYVNIWSCWEQFGLSWCFWDSALKQCFNSSSLLDSVLRQGTFSWFQTSGKCRKLHIDNQWFLTSVVVCCIFCLLSFLLFDSCFILSLCNSGKSFINFSLLFLFLSLPFSFKISLFFSR